MKSSLSNTAQVVQSDVEAVLLLQVEGGLLRPRKVVSLWAHLASQAWLPLPWTQEPLPSPRASPRDAAA
eukprot:CAMPEP_0171272118 /NCGR_PEP_ID=MMETSP0790-20130122/61588_1 /TAXON_ID=2925 /ORGANISM="Alexandrium catenella, Strain OF101" /LENGTH=68 /DNA_ID=CAMNT_0011741033 /DNA_START=64 /DNA_END=267 /DNA_ORIENTATION=+